MTPIYKMIATQLIQELECAGCKVDCKDNGFAFDRAIFKLGINDRVNDWTDEMYDQYYVIEQEMINNYINQ